MNTATTTVPATHDTIDRVVSHWRAGKLPEDFVSGLMQDLKPNAKPVTKEEMCRRLLQIVALRHGTLEDDNFTYRATSSPTLCRLFVTSLPVAAPLVRSVTLRITNLYKLEETLPNVLQLLQTSPLLSRLTLIGNFNLTTSAPVAESTFVHKLLKGIGHANPRRLRVLQLRGMTADPGNVQCLKQQLVSLRVLVIQECSIEFMNAIFEGLQGHSTLRSVTFRSDLVPETLTSFLSSLPALRSFSGDGSMESIMERGNRHRSERSLALLQHLPPLRHLQSLTLGQVVTRGDDGTHVATVLHGMPNLQILDLGESFHTMGVGTAAFATMLTNLQQLQDLTIDSTLEDFHENYLARPSVSSLTSLTCHFRPSDRLLDRLLPIPNHDDQDDREDDDNDTTGAPSLTLRSLEIALWMNDARFCALLQRLERRDTNLISLTVNQAEAGSAMGQFLQRTLQVNRCLMYLSLRCSVSVLTALCTVFTDNTTNLASLHLEGIRDDTTDLIKAIRDMQEGTLRRLSLHYKVLQPLARQSLGDGLADLPITGLVVHLDGTDGMKGLHADEWAPSLEQNLSLTSIHIFHNAQTQPAWNILTRLVTTRNRIRGMVASSGGNPPTAGLWPYVLESLVPDRSSMYCVVKDLFWPLQRMVP
jgi:hypothetical protein